MSNASSSIPPHSLIAFALFLRLPGYSEILLKEKKKAQCLLRMILGVADEVSSLTFGGGMAGNLLSSFPFQVLVCLFDVTPLSTDEGVLLRRMCMEIGVVHLILACLSILGHHAPRQFIPGIYQEILKVASLSQIQQQPSSSSTAAPSTTTFVPTATTSTFAAASANKSDFSAAGVSSINSSVMGLVSGIIKKSGADEKTPNYWAKGTGFGTGSTASNWDAEQLLAKQKCEEEHVTSLLLVLASFISPRTSSVSSSSSLNNFESRLSSRPDLLTSSSKTKSSFSNQSSGADLQRSVVAGESSSENSNYLPAGLPALLSQSCLVPALSSYLRNDSVLDMACHVPLYRALLQVLQSIATCQSLISLLLPLPDNNGNDELASSSSSSISSLLDKMRKCVDTYALRLKGNKGQQKAAQMTTASSANTSVASSTAAMAAEDEESEGLALLIPEIQETSVIVNRAIADYLNASGISLTSQKKKDMMSASSSSTMMAMTSSVMGRMSQSQEEKYISVMKLLQYDTYKMVSESNNLPIFTLPHHYESNVKAAGDVNNPVRARRLAQETVTLSTSLPLSVGSSVFVRCDEERLDVMKVLMTGPTDTPYSNGCFEFDVFFPVDYPNSPPLINLETTGGNSIRFNPNLYNDGKVCLSIINTWHGRPEERWHSQTSSFLQVLVSIQSLILVHEPYFNEPGYERSRGTPSGTASSREYDANIRQATVKWAMLEMIKNPPLAFKQIIQWHFWLKKDEIVSQIESWVQETEMYSKDKRVGRNISHSLLLLKRHFAQLKEEFAKMTIPEDVQPVDDDNDDDFTDNNNNNSDDNDNADDDNDNGISFKVPKECPNS
ncbi:hypothetical protein HELRODRAFT_113622 [Helobdella robusta]|uniref:UBC core domain-containing protein n=1 Tax=Helobdella robusta TaxID=6412 RepID=T1EFU3_HELRO|nr:hypothetical protein HELRODRAFT_113622 [Helobdella robusta]ESN99491.1 hypothetical protein HELRODRAFT_113622 [Helobdella robusta]